MAKRCQGLNSKCFLFTYLMIVGFLLVLWLNKLPDFRQETRTIPEDLKSEIVSPVRPLPEFILDSDNEQVLTNDFFMDKWTFVYFSFRHCLPACQRALATLKTLRRHFATQDIQFLIIDIDAHDSARELAVFLQQQGLNAQAATGDKAMIEVLARAFVALYLQTDFADGSYMIEQKHNIFLVDPKGRLYADFKTPYSAAAIGSQFIKLRRFYAVTE